METMTQENKDLLIKDLCARLSYGVKAKYYGSAEECECCDIIEGIYPIDNEVVIGQYGLSIDNIKPYLFPLSNMTEDQTHDFFCRFVENEIDYIDFKHYYVEQNRWNKIFTTISDCFAVVDWFNKNHFDYRCLIPKGLAIDATGLNVY